MECQYFFLFFCFAMHISVIFYKISFLFLCISYIFFFIPTVWLLFFYNCCYFIFHTIILFFDSLLIFRFFLFFDIILLFSVVLFCLLQYLYLTNKRTIFPLPDLSFYDRITLVQRLDDLAGCERQGWNLQACWRTAKISDTVFHTLMNRIGCSILQNCYKQNGGENYIWNPSTSNRSKTSIWSGSMLPSTALPESPGQSLPNGQN